MQSASKITAKQLQSLEGDLLRFAIGSREAWANEVGTPHHHKAHQLVFVSNAKDLESCLAKASLLILDQKVTLPPEHQLRPDQAVWVTPQLRAALALVLPLFDRRVEIERDLPSKIQGAFVHPTAQIGEGTQIFSGAMIGAHVKIGKNCVIRSGAIVEDFCEIGDRCILQAGSVVGSDGFGFYQDSKGVSHKIPQIGIVVLEDDVEVGSLTTIDRATLGETRIGQGSKFDKNCHVAHNCQIGKHNLFAGGSMIAGSSTTGDFCTVAGGSLISDHVTVTSRVMIGGRAAVTNDISSSGAYTGYPLEPMKDGLRTIQNLRHLTQMRRTLKLIQKKLGLNEEGDDT